MISAHVNLPALHAVGRAAAIKGVAYQPPLYAPLIRTSLVGHRTAVIHLHRSLRNSVGFHVAMQN